MCPVNSPEPIARSSASTSCSTTKKDRNGLAEQSDIIVLKLSLLQKLSKFCRSPNTHDRVAITVIATLIVVGLIIYPAGLGYLLFGFLIMIAVAPKIFDKQINFSAWSLPQPHN